MKALLSKQEIWQRELGYARDPAVWRGFAHEAASCARFLNETWRTAMVADVAGATNPQAVSHTFFAPKFVRLLMGIALENAVKGVLCAGTGDNRFVRAGRIHFQGRKGHDLLWLCQEAKMVLTKDAEFYVSAWAICAEWFGKYPFPLEVNRVLDEPQPLGSSAALAQRGLRGKRKYMIRDLLHGEVGPNEWAAFEAVFGQIDERLSVVGKA